MNPPVGYNEVPDN